MTPSADSRTITQETPAPTPAPEPPKPTLQELCRSAAKRNCKVCFGRGMVRRIPAGKNHTDGLDLPCRCVTKQLKPEHLKAAGLK